MKVRESGMPAEDMWDSFFDPGQILRKLQLNETCTDVVEFGCGYGTFTVAAARLASGLIYALDIDPLMLDIVSQKIESTKLSNVEVIERDFVAEGTGRPDRSADYAMLFNILHTDEPIAMLTEALRILRPGGCAGVIHWNYDPLTPRGPPMAIRPRPSDCKRWASQIGFNVSPVIDLPPYHYGFVLNAPS